MAAFFDVIQNVALADGPSWTRIAKSVRRRSVHDIVEMAFAGHAGLDVTLDGRAR